MENIELVDKKSQILLSESLCNLAKNLSKDENIPRGGRDMENFVPGERPDGEMPGGAKNKFNNTSSIENTTEQNNVE